jgi:hypothetical protein
MSRGNQTLQKEKNKETAERLKHKKKEKTNFSACSLGSVREGSVAVMLNQTVYLLHACRMQHVSVYSMKLLSGQDER